MTTSAWGRFRSEGHRLVVTAFSAGERLGKAADRFLRPYRLSLAQFNVLVVLASEPRGVPQVYLGRRLIVSRANITGLVRRLKRRGTCAVVADAADRRVKRVRLTAAGRRLLRAIEGPYFREIGRMTSALGRRDLRRTSQLLDTLMTGVP